MINLLHARASELVFRGWGLWCLLDERMDHDDASADQEAIERSTHAGSAAQAEFKQAIAHGS